MAKRATIREVALRAGVSPAAVSKVLRNAYGTSGEMRRKVEAAIAELDYRPQTAARGLRGSTYTIGVLIPDIRNPFFPDILDGAANELAATGYKMFLAIGHSERETEHSLVDAMLDAKMDGLLLIAPRIEAAGLAKLARSVPTVIIGRHEHGGGFDTVNNDDEEGARQVVSHLHSLGHRRIAHLGLRFSQDFGESVNFRRLRGYETRMEELGLEPHVVLWEGTFADAGREGALAMLGQPRLFASRFAWAKDGRVGAIEMLKQAQRPTAIFGWTDNVALGALSGATELGLRVPEDLSVVGYDNSGLCDINQISLTSVDQSAHVLGETSMRLLLERVGGRIDETHFVVPPKLVVRRSSGAAPAAKKARRPLTLASDR